MAETTVKHKVLKAIEELPHDATFEDVLERLYFLYKTDNGSLCPRRNFVQRRRACRAGHERGGGHQARRGARDAYCDALLSRYRSHGDVLHALWLAGYDARRGQLFPV